MNPDEIIAIVQAKKEGKEIQYREKQSCHWFEHQRGFNFDFNKYEFRVALPKPKIIYVNEWNPLDSAVFGYAYRSQGDAKSLRNAACLKVAIEYIELTPEIKEVLKKHLT